MISMRSFHFFCVKICGLLVFDRFLHLLLDFQDYSEMSLAYRPSHADATYDFKYGVRSVQVMSKRSSFIITKFCSLVISNSLQLCFVLCPYQCQWNEQGGGRSSARETIGRVAAGAVAKKILKLYSGTEVRYFIFVDFLMSFLSAIFVSLDKLVSGTSLWWWD